MSKMTAQLEILTSMMSGQKENSELVINPFYGATKERVEDNYIQAKKVYRDVFRRFIYVWFTSGNRTNPPPYDWEKLNIEWSKNL